MTARTLPVNYKQLAASHVLTGDERPDLADLLALERESREGMEPLEGTPEGLSNEGFRQTFGKGWKVQMQMPGEKYPQSYGVGGWDVDCANRKEFQGKIVQGPHAYLFGLGVMLTATADPMEFALVLEAGDVIRLRGVDYLVSVDRSMNNSYYPHLTPVS